MAVKEKEREQLKLIVKKKSFDYGLFIVVLILLAIGLVMILSASAPYSLRTEGDSYYYVKRQLLFAVIGVVCMLVISKIDYRVLNSRLAYLAYLVRSWTHGTCISARNWCRKKWSFTLDKNRYSISAIRSYENRFDFIVGNANCEKSWKN